jgi:hypothetical protein
MTGSDNRILEKMAGVTRLELAASGVTGRRSNQLSYTPVVKRPRCTTSLIRCQAGLLHLGGLTEVFFLPNRLVLLVGAERLELPTFTV